MFNDELTIRLSQHTPLVVDPTDRHFFIRSTELKPKLNKFLLSRYRTLFDGAAPNDWLIGKGKAEAVCLNFAVLDCALHAEDIDVRESKIIGAEVLLLTANRHSDALRFRIQSDIPRLLAFVRDHIQDFFIIANFGRRQSKGYGQFTVIQIDDKPIADPDLQRLGSALHQFYKPVARQEYYAGYCTLPSDNFSFPENHNDWTIYYSEPERSMLPYLVERNIYQKLKSGQNYSYSYEDQNTRKTRDVYYKSFLFKYLSARGEDAQDSFEFPGWAKRAIKHGLQKNNANAHKFLKKNPSRAQYHAQNEHPDPDYNQALYARSVLGISENFEFLMYGPFERMKVKIKHERGTIEQFASPLRIKIFSSCVFLVPLLIPDQLFQEPFTFNAELVVKPPKNSGSTDNTRQGVSLAQDDMETLVLSSPPKIEISHFLNYRLPGDRTTIAEKLRLQVFQPTA